MITYKIYYYITYGAAACANLGIHIVFYKYSQISQNINALHEPTHGKYLL